MLNWILGKLGLNKLWDKVNGCKAYIGATITILSGLVMFMQGSIEALQAFLIVWQTHDWVQIYQFFTTFNAATWYGVILTGIGTMGVGLRHAQQKVFDATTVNNAAAASKVQQ